MTTLHPNAAAQVEATIAAYLRDYYDPATNDPAEDQNALDVLCRREDTPLAGIAIVEAQTGKDYALPCVIVSAETGESMANDPTVSWERIPISVSVVTAIAEDVDEETGEPTNRAAAAAHASRVGQVKGLLAAYNFATSQSQTPPAYIFGWYPSSSDSAQTDKAFADNITFTACAGALQEE